MKSILRISSFLKKQIYLRKVFSKKLKTVILKYSILSYSLLTAFTISTNLYLPQACVLAKSFLQHNTGCEFYIALLDDEDDYNLNYLNKHKIKHITIDKIGISQFNEMRNRYNAFEMSCAMKPFVAQYFLNNCDTDYILYFDSDILVYNEINVIRPQEYSILITPHCTKPLNRNDGDKMDLAILNFGIYNAGFFVINTNHIDSKMILNWWSNKLINNCIVDLKSGKYVDQIWLNLLPIYFKSTFIEFDLGYNVALWNIDERILFKEDNLYWVKYEGMKSRLSFFHFTGFKYNDKKLSSTHKDIIANEIVLEVYKEYKKMLYEADIEFFKPQRNFYNQIFSNNFDFSNNSNTQKWSLKKLLKLLFQNAMKK